MSSNSAVHSEMVNLSIFAWCRLYVWLGSVSHYMYNMQGTEHPRTGGLLRRQLSHEWVEEGLCCNGEKNRCDRNRGFRRASGSCIGGTTTIQPHCLSEVGRAVFNRSAPSVPLCLEPKWKKRLRANQRLSKRENYWTAVLVGSLPFFISVLNRGRRVATSDVQNYTRTCII